MTRPLAVRCAICRATHGSRIYRLKQNPRFWINCKPWHPELYEATPEVIDLTRAKVCDGCASRCDHKFIGPKHCAKCGWEPPLRAKPAQGKLF